MSRVRALIWKEWREQRPVLLAGIAAALSMPLFVAAGALSAGTPLSPGKAVEFASPVLAWAIWPLFAAAAAATAIAGEVAGGTMPFLLSRPVSRRVLWTFKALAAVAATLVVMVVSGAAFVLLLGVLGGGRTLDASDLFRGSVAGAIAAVLVLVCTLHTSSFVRRPLLAGLAGVVMSVGSGFLAVGISSPPWATAPSGPLTEISGLAIVGVAVVAGAVHGFSRAEVFQRTGRRARGTRALGLTALVYVGAMAPLIWVGSRVPTDGAYFRGVTAHPSGGLFAVDAGRFRRGSTRIWVLHRDGTVERRGPSGGWVVSFTADGEWIVHYGYEHRGAIPGLGDYVPTLRAMRLDGRDGRRLLENYTGDVALSSEGDRMAVSALRSDGGRDLVLLRASTGVERRIDLGSLELAWPEWYPRRPPGHSPARRLRVVEWLNAGSALLLAGPGPTFVVLDLQRETGRVLSDDPFEEARGPGDVGLVGIRDDELLVQVRERTGGRRSGEFRYHLDAYDLATGATRRLLTRDASCGTVDLVPFEDLRHVLYWTCEADDAAAGPRVRLHVADLESPRAGPDQDRVLGLFPGEDGAGPFVRGRRAVLALRHRDGGTAALVVHVDGEVRHLPRGWEPEGWVSDDEVLLVRHAWSVSGEWGGGPSGLAIADLRTGVLEVVYPPGRPDGSFR